MIELREGADEEVRRDIFSRINTSSQNLKPMEERWGSMDGPFLDFVKDCSQNPLFIKLAPLSQSAVARKDLQEFVLRFFAYLNGYQKFNRSVVGFLNEYLDGMEIFDNSMKSEFQSEWERMLNFVEVHFKTFGKKRGHARTPRIRFEAISVGTALALREEPNLVPATVEWIESEAFKAHMRSDASNSRPKVIARIEFVRDHLLSSAS